MRRIILLLLLPMVAHAADSSLWVTSDATGAPQVQLYFFWSERCPHCLEALPHIEQLPQQYPWLAVHSVELTRHRDNVQQFVQMAASLGQEARSVPAFLFCGQMQVGYDAAVGQQLEKSLQTCYRQVSTGWTLGEREFNFQKTPALITLPIIGTLEPQQFSLPALTVMLAALDSFNPCAFFVLLSLLSLLVHAQHRGRMLLVGGIFVLFSGVIYFLFMAAWLNIFLWIGQLYWVTFAAGVLAIVMAIINIKDYFWLRHGVTLSIPDQAKPGLIARMRQIITSSRSITMLGATILLAIAANSYELLCTAGFPMVYTRLLTLQTLTSIDYYLYIALYSIIYVIPLLIIVLLFVWKLGARKLQEHEGRKLKLLSGLMMLGLGIVLVINPVLLSNILVALTLVICSILLLIAIVRFFPPQK